MRAVPHGGDLALRRTRPGLVLEQLLFGEHTGTHFDAPMHWITGSDLPNNATDTIAAGEVHRAGLRDRLLGASARETRISCSPPIDWRAWEEQHGRIPPGAGC